jgi:hypothetical protein
MHDINPFEPWRPGPNDPRRGEDTYRSEPDEPEWYHPSASSGPTWPGERAEGEGVKKFFTFFSFALLVAGLIATGALGGPHVSRVAAAGAVLWLGLLLALVAGRRWRWYWRLGFFALAALGPVACWYLVPTTGGVSLLEAERRLADIRRLPVGDVKGYTSAAASRAQLGKEFPLWKGDVTTAERSWLRRTASEAITEANKLLERDPAAALGKLKKAQASLQRIDHFASTAQSEFIQARRHAVAARLKQVENDLGVLLLKGQFARFSREANDALEELVPDAAAVGNRPVVEARIRQLRVQGVRKQADAARDALEALLRRKEYAKVAEEGSRLQRELTPPAAVLGEDADLTGAIRPLREKAYQARLDAMVARLQGLFDKKDFEAVPKAAEEAAKELRPEGQALGQEGSIRTRSAGLREKAFRRRMLLARKTLDELFAKKDYVAVASRGKQLQSTLEGEAGVVGASGDLTKTLAEVRRKALKERLEQARKEALTLLAKDRYQAAGEVGERAVKEMGEEADAVASRAELDRFRDSCRVFADLAKKANIEDKK